jgi:hypothetical protein
MMRVMSPYLSIEVTAALAAEIGAPGDGERSAWFAVGRSDHERLATRTR